MIDHVAADLIDYEQRQDELERKAQIVEEMFFSMCLEEKEAIAEDYIKMLRIDGWKDHDFSECLSISVDDNESLDAMMESDKDKWEQVITSRVATFWENKLIEFYQKRG